MLSSHFFWRFSRALSFVGFCSFVGLVSARPAMISTEDCASALQFESALVTDTFNRSKKHISDQHRCLVRSLDEVPDIGSLVNSLPEKTVLILKHRNLISRQLQASIEFNDSAELPISLDVTRTSRQALIYKAGGEISIDLPADSASTVGTVNLVEFRDSVSCLRSKTPGRLPKDTVMLGVNEDYPGGTIPICEGERPHKISYMFELGGDSDFEDAGHVYVSGFSFFPLLDNNPDPIDSIWRVRCYTGDLVFETNTFRLDTRAAVYLQCTHGTSKPVSFEFLDNSVVGMGSARSEEGLLVDLRHISPENVQMLALISGNYFAGNIKTAIEIRLDENAQARIFQNLVYPATTEISEVSNAIELYGPEDSLQPPYVVLRGNKFRTHDSIAQMFGKLVVNLSGNQFASQFLIQAKPYVLDYRLNVSPDIRITSTEPNRWWPEPAKKSSCPSFEGREYIKGGMEVHLANWLQCNL